MLPFCDTCSRHSLTLRFKDYTNMSSISLISFACFHTSITRTYCNFRKASIVLKRQYFIFITTYICIADAILHTHIHGQDQHYFACYPKYNLIKILSSDFHFDVLGSDFCDKLKQWIYLYVKRNNRRTLVPALMH